MLKKLKGEKLFTHELENILKKAIFSDGNVFDFNNPRNSVLIFTAFFINLPLTFNKIDDSKAFFKKHKTYMTNDFILSKLFNSYYDKYRRFFTKGGSFRQKIFNDLVFAIYQDEKLDYKRIKHLTTINDYFEKAVKSTGLAVQKYREVSAKTEHESLDDLNYYYFLKKDFLSDALIFNQHKKNGKFHSSKSIFIDADQVACKDNLHAFLKLKEKKGDFFELSHISGDIIKDIDYIYEYAILNYILPEVFLFCLYEPLISHGATYNISTYIKLSDLLSERSRNSVDTFEMTNFDLLYELIEDLIFYTIIKNSNLNLDENKIQKFVQFFIPEVCEYIINTLSDIDFNKFLNTYMDVRHYNINQKGLPIDYGTTHTENNYDFQLNLQEQYNTNLSDFLNIIEVISSQREYSYYKNNNKYKGSKRVSFFIGESEFNNDLFIEDEEIFVADENMIEAIEKIFNFGGVVVFTDNENKNTMFRIVRAVYKNQQRESKTKTLIPTSTIVASMDKPIESIELIIQEYLALENIDGDDL